MFTLPVNVAAVPVTLFTAMFGVLARLNAVVAKATDVPAPSVEVPFTVKFPETVKSAALETAAALNALYATASITSPFCAPPANIEKVDPFVDV